MDNQEIKNKYEKLMEDVKTNDYYTKIDMTNRVNYYICRNCNKAIKTIDIDRGCTPFMIRHECGNMANSVFYTDIPALSKLKPEKEWYRPTLDEIFKWKENQSEEMFNYNFDHLMNGGLFSRAIKNYSPSPVNPQMSVANAAD